MTNQSSTLREPERESDHLRPPLHVTPKSESLEATINCSSSKRLKPERGTPSPTRLTPQQQQQQQQLQHSHHQLLHHHHHHQQQQKQDRHQSERSHERQSERQQPLQHQLPPSPPTPLALYPRKLNRDYSIESTLNDENPSHHHHHHQHPKHSAIHDDRVRTPEEYDEDDEEEDDNMSNENGLYFNIFFRNNNFRMIHNFLCFVCAQVLT